VLRQAHQNLLTNAGLGDPNLDIDAIVA